MIRSWRAFAWALFAVSCMAAWRYYVHVEQEHALLDDRLSEHLMMGLDVQLDCPPFGQRKVHFDPENSTPENVDGSMPNIVKQWAVLWPTAYSAILAEAKNYGAGDEVGNYSAITVVLPNSSFGPEAKWDIDFGNFTAEMKGDQATHVSAY